MAHTIESLHQEHHVGGGRKEIMKVTLILSVLTLIELGLGYAMIGMEDGFMKHLIKGIICILMLAKAFYIVGYFMHLKHEVRNLIMTVIVPLFLFIWFILAFLADGNSFKTLKNNYDRHHRDASLQKVEKKEEGHSQHGERE
jgi:cytochrome c oxidase subunit IV